MSLLDELQKKWNEMLTEKVEEKKESQGNSSGGTGGNNSTPLSPIEEIEKFVQQQYETGKYDTVELPDVPVYERMEANTLSDKEIESQAKSSLNDYSNLTTAGIEDEIKTLEKKYQSDKAKIAENYESEDKKLEGIYEQAKTSASNDMLKRGLARSSISANVSAGLDSEMSQKRADALRVYIEGIKEIDGEISGLESKRQKALNDFNIAYAAKLTDAINSLKDKREEKIAETLKYNNSLTEKEHAANVQKQMYESDLYTEELTQAQKEKDLGTITTAQQNLIYENSYNKMDEILGGMSKKEAKALLSSNDIFRKNLSDYYYYKLYDKYGR